MKIKLKPCPFCGGKARHKTAKYNELGAYGKSDTERRWHGVYCTVCLVGQPKRHYFTEEEAVEAWNTRKDGTENA